MLTKEAQQTRRSIDPGDLDRIVREVIRRLLRQTIDASQTNDSQTITTNDAVITSATIANLTGTPTTLLVGTRAVVTPAAKDEAKTRNISIARVNTTSAVTARESDIPKDEATFVIDTVLPERAEAVNAQLDRRGIPTNSKRKVLLSDQPAADVYEQCNAKGHRAVMVTHLADVDRFEQELSPTIWVLDMARLNFTAATNVAARIAKLG